MIMIALDTSPLQHSCSRMPEKMHPALHSSQLQKAEVWQKALPILCVYKIGPKLRHRDV
jgi:hypothetical protein